MTSPTESLFRPRKLDGITTTESHPGAVTLLTTMGNKITATLTTENVQRFAALLAECVGEDS